MNISHMRFTTRWCALASIVIAAMILAPHPAAAVNEPDPPAEDSAATPQVDVNDGTALLPSPETMRTLTTETLLAFNRAIRAKNFAPFHKEQLSRQFGADFTPEALLETFQPFIENDVNIGGVEHVDPVFDPEPSTEGDVMTLKGFYPTRPMRVLFDLSYVLEAGKWRLHGLSVRLKNAGGPQKTIAPGGAAVDPPSGAALNKLVSDTLLEFDKAVKAKDFKALHAKGSTPMRWQTKPDQLKEAFQSFIEQGPDLSKIAKLEPEFDGPPVVEQKTMTVKGSYRLDRMFLLFELDYYLERGQWKLLAIGVNTVAPSEIKSDTVPRDEKKRKDEKKSEDGGKPDDAVEKPADE